MTSTEVDDAATEKEEKCVISSERDSERERTSRDEGKIPNLQVNDCQLPSSEEDEKSVLKKGKDNNNIPSTSRTPTSSSSCTSERTTTNKSGECFRKTAGEAVGKRKVGHEGKIQTSKVEEESKSSSASSSSSSMPPLLRITSIVPGEMEREELRDRLEQSLGYTTCRLPRVLTVAQRRRAGMVKQWSMDETKSWFYSRSSSLDRAAKENKGKVEEEDEGGASNAAAAAGAPAVAAAPPPKIPAERRRKFFQRKNTSSAPTSSTDSLDSGYSRPGSQDGPGYSGAGAGIVSKALEEVLRASALFSWDSCDLDEVSGLPTLGRSGTSGTSGINNSGCATTRHSSAASSSSGIFNTRTGRIESFFCEIAENGTKNMAFFLFFCRG